MATTENKVNNSEYSYTERSEFTSEIYKIEVRNLGIFGIGVNIHKKLIRIKYKHDKFFRNLKSC